VRRVSEGRRAFGQFLHVEEDRHQINVGDGELIADEMAGFGDRSVENFELFAHRGRHRFD
jgi:hypothetical protein